MSFTAANKSRAGKSKKAAAEPAVSAISIPAGSTAKAMVAELVSIDQIRIMDKNDRVRDAAFEERVRERAASMAEIGLLQPIMVRKAKSPSDVEYILVAGEIRFLAAMLLGWAKIAAVTLDDGQDVLDVRAAENLQRTDLDEDSKAMQVGALLDREIQAVCTEQGVGGLDGLDAPAIDAVRVAATKRVAERMGWPVSRVRDYAFAAELPEEVLSLARQGRLSLAHLRVLAQVPDPKRAVEIAKHHAAGTNTLMEPMRPLDDLKDVVARETCRLSAAPWDMNVAFAGGPACVKCPHNSANRTGLFDGADFRPDYTSQFDVGKGPLNDRQIEAGLCSKLSCYRAKTAATKQAWRGAGDRIAAKVAAAKPAERPALQNKLVKEAAERCEFVPLTTFGKLARERIGQKLEDGSSKGKAKASADRSVKAGNDAAKWKAQDAHRKAENVWFNDRLAALEKHIKGWTVEQQAMLYLLFSWSQIGQDLIGWDAMEPTPARLNALKLVLRHIAAMPGTNPLGAILTNKPKRQMFFGAEGDEMNVQVLRAMLEVFAFEYPEPPVLADFLPKPEKKPAAAKPKAAKKPAKKSATKKAAVAAGEEA